MAQSFQSIRTRLTEEIIARIQDGRYPAGMRLIELKMAEEFGVSQSPVREALRELEARRYVESLPYKGTRVRILTATEIRDAYLVRAVLEECACHLVARAKVDLRGIARACTAASKAADRSDFRSFVKHDASFHRQIVECSSNVTLVRTWEALQAEARVAHSFIEGTKFEFHNEHHDEVLDALKNGDGVRAGNVVKKHLEMVSQFITDSPFST